jgi:hypothetical protein
MGGEGEIADTATITGYRKLLVTFMDIPKVAIIKENFQFALNSFFRLYGLF